LRGNRRLMDSHAPSSTPGGVTHPRRCPGPLPQRSGAAARRLGGRCGDCGHAVGGGSSARGRWTSRGLGGPLLPMTAPSGASSAPKTLLHRRTVIAARKRTTRSKNVLLVNALLIILFLSDIFGGRTHDKRIADATPYPLPAGSRLLQDLGF